jgi:hypothetical protein
LNPPRAIQNDPASKRPFATRPNNQAGTDNPSESPTTALPGSPRTRTEANHGRPRQATATTALR